VSPTAADDAAPDQALERVRRRLLEAGASAQDIEAARAEGTLDLLAVETLLVPGPRTLTPRQVSEASGLPLPTLTRLWRALGFLEPGDDEQSLTPMDLEAARALCLLMALGVTEAEGAVQLARVVGSSMARIAEANLLRAADTLRAGDDSVAAADAFAGAADEVLGAFGTVLDFAWRRHLQAVARRSALLRSGGHAAERPVLAVGFADMVGFTLLSQHLSDEELGAVVRRFEEISFETVAAHGGRVVKTIGDEAMFVVQSVAAAARIGVGLAEAYATDTLLSDVRVGMSAGPVLVRDGDYFGPTVNLASRIVRIAEPGTVLVSDDFHRLLEAEAPGEFAGRALRPRSLKDVGRVQLWACRRAGDPSAADGADRRPARRSRLLDALHEIEELRAAGERLLAAGRRPGHAAGGAQGAGPGG
jgi:adenylate cyclase